MKKSFLFELVVDVLRCLRLLDKRARRKVFALTIIQITLASLDLIGILLLGFLTLLSIGEQSVNQLQGKRYFLLEQLDSLFEKSGGLLTFLACSSVFVLVARTILSSFVTYNTFKFMAQKSAELSSTFTEQILRQPYLSVKRHSTNELTLILTRGIEMITLQIIAPLTLILSDTYTLMILSILLMFLDPLTFIGVISVFIFSILALNYFIKSKPEKVGEIYNELNVVVVEKISESIDMLKETKSKQRFYYYKDFVLKNRLEYGSHSANLRFMPYVGKYFVEILIVIGAAVFGLIQLVILESPNAIANSVMFIAAGSRIAPTILRIQQGTLGIRGSLGMSRSTLNLINTLMTSTGKDMVTSVELKASTFNPVIEILNVDFTYPFAATPTLKDINFGIKRGNIVGIVGSSGSGKSTLLDLMMGFMSPSRGSILLSGKDPKEAVALWPSEISYVSQESHVVKGTIRQNLELGLLSASKNDHQLQRALHRAGLSEFMIESHSGLDTFISENGENLSSGQKQRLVLARAFISEPSLIIMDESTSNLDAATEGEILQSLISLKGHATVVIVTHRVASLVGADWIYIMKNGQIIKEGSWLEVKEYM